MKTTLDIDDSLHARAKEEAARRRMPLTGLIEEALRRLLDPQGSPRRRPRFKVKPRNLRMKPGFREMNMNRLAAQLAAVALEHNGTIHSNDDDFGRFAGLHWVNPMNS